MMNGMIVNEKLYIKENIQEMELFFKDIKSSSDMYKTMDTHNDELSSIIYDEFNMYVSDIYIVKAHKHFFGMRIFPSKEELQNKTMEIMNNDDGYVFKDCNEVVIEIDSQLIESFSTRQIVAVLLHEIGHKAENSKIADEINNVYTRKMSAISEPVKDLNSSNYKEMGRVGSFTKMTFATLFSMPSDLLLGKNKTEVRADSFAVKYGYGQALSEALLKVRAFVKGQQLDDEDRDSFIGFMLDLGDNFLQRRRRILKDIKKNLDMADSPYERELLKSQIRFLEKN